MENTPSLKASIREELSDRGTGAYCPLWSESALPRNAGLGLQWTGRDPARRIAQERLTSERVQPG
jgi:hypothetical protein